MNVLFCLSHINKSLQWEWYAEELKNRGINQHYVIIDDGTGANEPALVKDLRNLGIPVSRLSHHNKLSHIKNIGAVRGMIRKQKPDVIHTSLPFGNLVGLTAGILCNHKAMVTTCENASWAHDFQHKKQQWLDNFAFRYAHAVVATSEIAAEYLRKEWKFDHAKMQVIYHGVKRSVYEVPQDRVERLRHQLGWKEGSYQVGVLSRFEFWKGHDTILEAARILKNENVKIYVFGSKGSYYDTAMQKIKEYGLQDMVIYGGFVEDTPALYRLFDLHLHIPINPHVETGGITIIEGMIARVPQVLTRSGYAYQASRHMKNAYVVPFEDPAATAEAILWMKGNGNLAREMAGQAHQDALSEFSVTVKTDAHLNMYRGLTTRP